MPHRYKRRLIVLASLLLTAGCGKAKPSATQAREKDKTADKKMEIPGAVTGTGWHIPWRMHDRKHKGKWIPVLVADARHGVMTNEESSTPTAQLSDVRVSLFRDGKPAALVIAPEMTAREVSAEQRTGDDTEREVIGTGGCTVTSLTKPDTVLKADTIRWNTGTEKIVAEGHASVVRRAQNGGPEITQTGGRITVDTSLKGNFVVE